ncbi:hypothetical protein GCM10022289_43300 [Pedobacter jeongneungensis]|uniref:Uncharacterized protein n=1 Tax=Pedobacter jeongneungensis TaxID=947309 RepID=A0ABP8BQJ4_9SPHI
MTTPAHTKNSWLIKQRFFNRHPKELLFTPQFISFGNQKLSVSTISDLSQGEPLQYRFGIEWIRGFEFTVGRKYQLFIKNGDGETIKISFGSYYGINKISLFNQYIEILNQLWRSYFDGLVDQYLELFKQKIPFTLANVKFDEFGIKIKSASFIKEEEKSLPWDDVGTKDYQTYFAIFSKQAPSLINKGYSYLDNWNTRILYSVVQTILLRREGQKKFDN